MNTTTIQPLHRSVLLVAAAALTLVCNAHAAVRHVDPNSPSPTPPFTNWLTAAHTIQAAVDAALPGDEILVTNGVYASGGRVVHGSLTNRVAVTKPVTLRSVHGPEVTVIEGSRSYPRNTAIRCVYLADGAILDGFTLRNGATRGRGEDLQWFERSGAGLYCESKRALATNCVITGNVAHDKGGGVYSGTLWYCQLIDNEIPGFDEGAGGGACASRLHHCLLTGNAVGGWGGGASASELFSCVLSNNFAGSGGGVATSVLEDCRLEGNRARYRGGGVTTSTLWRCVLKNNSASSGGAASGGASTFACTLNHCFLMGNSARGGGGTIDVDLNHCLLIDNTATWGALGGGGSIRGILNHCTLVGNTAEGLGGGAMGSTLNNCIAYYNNRGHPLSKFANLYECEVNDSCTTPLPSSGIGNIDAEPRMASMSHLGVDSPCRGLGDPQFSLGIDIDGEATALPPSLGCDEPIPGSIGGPLSVDFDVSHTNVATGFTIQVRARIEGKVSESRWAFGDGTILTNRPLTSHAYPSPGTFPLVLQAFNEDHPQSLAATAMVHVVATPIHHVAVGSTNPIPPFDSWATAAPTIQDAVDAAEVTGALVLVSNGTYRTGGRTAVDATTNRVSVTKPLVVRSVNGPSHTIIQGGEEPVLTNGVGAIRCVYLTHEAVLQGFTLTLGAAASGPPWSTVGGGVLCESFSSRVRDCILATNFAYWGGGGASGGHIENSVLVGNTSSEGGGAVRSILSECLLQGNLAWDNGGGTLGGMIESCVIQNNQALSGAGVSGGWWMFRSHLSANVALRDGGGTVGGTLVNCELRGNQANRGGGAYYGDLFNCTLVGNHASERGGGASGSVMENCILYFNTSDTFNPNYDGDTRRVNYSCLTPLPTEGFSNIDDDPLFMDVAAGDLRLQSNSPCINAGYNRNAPPGLDLDGLPRIAGATVDLGAYEFQSPQSLLSYAWLRQHGLPLDGSADHEDPDADSSDNYQEWLAGTQPDDANSVFRLLTPVFLSDDDEKDLYLTWISGGNRRYFIEYTTQLGTQPPWQRVASDIRGTEGSTTFKISEPKEDEERLFYRVGVH